jgi:hypothetical protein
LLTFGIEIEHSVKFHSVSMKLTAGAGPISEATSGCKVEGQQTGGRLDVHWQDMLQHVELTDGRLLGIVTDIA